jgi:hypothetical protein
MREAGSTLEAIAAALGVSVASASRWCRGVKPTPPAAAPAPAERPPPAPAPPAGADRLTWLRAELTRAHTESAASEGSAGVTWAKYALAVRNALDAAEAEDRRALEAAGRQGEIDPEEVARRVLRVVPALGRLVSRAEGLRIYAELGRVLGVTEEVG